MWQAMWLGPGDVGLRMNQGQPSLVGSSQAGSETKATGEIDTSFGRALVGAACLSGLCRLPRGDGT